MNRFYFFLFLWSTYFLSISQENYNLRIDLDTSKPIFLHSVSFVDSSLVKINQDTTFFISSKKNNLFYIETGVEKYYLFLTEDSKLDLIIKSNDIIISGENDSFVRFLNDYFKLHQSSFNNKLESFPLYRSIDEFEILLYNFINEELFDFYQTNQNFQDFSLQSKLYFETLVKYEYLNTLSTFLFQKYTQNKKMSDSQQFMPFLNDINIDLLKLETFEKSFDDISYYDMEIFQNYIFNTSFLFSVSKYNQQLESIDDFQLFSVYFFNYMLNHVPSDFFSYCIQKYVENFCSLFQKNTTNYVVNLIKEQQFDKKYITAITNFLESNYNPDQETPDVADDIVIKDDFYMEDLNGEQVSLSMFKGKVLYVDIWASWCGPCRKQFPHSKELKNKFSRKQLKKIKFIYISIDNDYTKWKESIKKLNIEGYHFISPAKHSHSAGSYFGVSSIPRYIIIGKKGDIIEHNAKRPSDETLFNELIELIN